MYQKRERERDKRDVGPDVIVFKKIKNKTHRPHVGLDLDGRAARSGLACGGHGDFDEGGGLGEASHHLFCSVVVLKRFVVCGNG
jgi:hypothetical protein